MRRSTSAVRRACAVGTTVALIGLTTGLGIMTATSASAATGDEPVSTTTTAPAAEGTSSDATTGSDAGTPAAGGSDTGADTGTGAGANAGDAGTGGGTGTNADPAGTDTAPGSGTGSEDEGQTSGDEPGSTTTTPPATPSTDQPTAGTLAAQDGKVTIEGTAEVGKSLTAEATGFAPSGDLRYTWSAGGDELNQGQVHVVKASDAGKVLRVTVTNSLNGTVVESQYAETAVVTQAPQFVDADGTVITDGTQDDGTDLYIGATAGERFSYTFRATGSPAPPLALTWYYEGQQDEPGVTPADQLPVGVSFDPETGVLSGTTEDASDYSFAVTATSGQQQIVQTVDLYVAAAAPAGLEAFAVDRATFLDFVQTGFPTDLPGDDGDHSGNLTAWIIGADGSITTEETQYDSSADGGEALYTDTPGGQVTVPQGGTLLISGNLVDRFGNFVDNEDSLGLTPVTVRSNVATDVIAADPLLGDVGFVGVTFPHASVHRLTVAATDFSTAFDVQVTPVVAPATPTVQTPVAQTPIGTVQHGTIPAAQHGRLAYTGADETAPLAWALGLLVAGAGLIGARTLRRRRAQR